MSRELKPLSGAEREAYRLDQFRHELRQSPKIASRLAKGQQFNAFDSASNDEDMPDERRQMSVCIGPVSDLGFIADVTGRAKAEMIAAALTFPASHAARPSPAVAEEREEALKLADEYAAKGDWNSAYHAMRIAYFHAANQTALLAGEGRDNG